MDGDGRPGDRLCTRCGINNGPVSLAEIRHAWNTLQAYPEREHILLRIFLGLPTPLDYARDDGGTVDYQPWLRKVEEGIMRPWEVVGMTEAEWRRAWRELADTPVAGFPA